MRVNDLDDASLRAAVKKAEELAAIAPPNPERHAGARAAGVSEDERFRRAHRAGARAGDDPARQDDHRRGLKARSWWRRD